MKYNDIKSDDFKNLKLDEQIEIINQGLKTEGTLLKVCTVIGINSKHWSEKFRNNGYTFSKLEKAFIKDVPVAPTIPTAEVNKTAPKKAPAIKKTSKTKPVADAGISGNPFIFYYVPSGNIKKMGASVDTEVYKEFEKICNQFNYVNVSGHISNALALYIKTLKDSK